MSCVHGHFIFVILDYLRSIYRHKEAAENSVVGMTLVSLNYIILLFLLFFFYQGPGCYCSRVSLAFSAVPVTSSSSVDNSRCLLVSKVLRSSHMVFPMHCTVFTYFFQLFFFYFVFFFLSRVSQPKNLVIWTHLDVQNF